MNLGFEDTKLFVLSFSSCEVADVSMHERQIPQVFPHPRLSNYFLDASSVDLLAPVDYLVQTS